ncbi:MAG: HAD-IA family hydrolase [Acholeplasmatales bacterium]|jgi:phosphoglycolate phosphatase|nr:HAD-IA family hydrolase [Acholeplasmatales bacterium]
MKLVIFDLDGTLLNTLSDLTLSINLMRQDFNLPKLKYKEVQKFLGFGNLYLVKNTITANIDFEKAYALFVHYYQIHQFDHTKLYPHVGLTIKKLKAKGYLISINSNKNEVFMERIITKFFGDQVDFYLGASLQYPPKPDPTAMNIILKHFNLSEQEAIYIGDTEVDYQSALNAKVKCILVTYGFRPGSSLESFPCLKIDKIKRLEKLL